MTNYADQSGLGINTGQSLKMRDFKEMWSTNVQQVLQQQKSSVDKTGQWIKQGTDNPIRNGKLARLGWSELKRGRISGLTAEPLRWAHKNTSSKKNEDIAKDCCVFEIQSTIYPE